MKPEIKSTIDLDYNVATGTFLSDFTKIAGMEGYFELKLRAPIEIIPLFDFDHLSSRVVVHSVVATNSASDYPDAKSITLTELKTTSGDDYSEFKEFLFMELAFGSVEKDGYVKFDKGFWLRARTKGNGRTGLYLIVGAEITVDGK